jgi:hypothetical protein
MTDTPDFPALVELAQRLEGKDKKTCELALYTLKKQDERIKRRDKRIDELECELSARPVVAFLSDIARIGALEAALLPFAAIADESTENLADDYMYPDCYPMSAFRAARAAYYGEKDG